MAKNWMGGAIKQPAAAPPKGMGQSARDTGGNPREDSADRQGDGMRPMTPAPISPKGTGRGHMGSWADKMHPMGRR